MQIALFASFVALAASLAAGLSLPSGPSDAQIKELSGSRLNPPYSPPNPKGENDVGWTYPTSKKVQQAKHEGKCSFRVIMDVSRCAGTAIRQGPAVSPYDAYSMSMIDGKIKSETGFTQIAPYAQKTITIDQCGFNGRFFLMDQFSDNLWATNRMSVRLVLEEGKASSWVTAQTDEETGYQQDRVAPLIRMFYGSDDKEEQGRIFKDEDKRGKQLSLKTTTNTTDNYLALQWC